MGGDGGGGAGRLGKAEWCKGRPGGVVWEGVSSLRRHTARVWEAVWEAVWKYSCESRLPPPM